MRIKNKVSIPMGVFMSITAVIGITLITLGSLVDVRFIPTSLWEDDFRDLAISLLYNIGQGLLVGGLIGMIFEIRSTKNYFEKRISDILIDDDYLKHQNYEALMKLRQRATKNIYDKKSNNVDLGLIELDKQICNDLTEPYFEFYQESAYCSLSEDKTYLKKKVITRFKLINPQNSTIELFDFLRPKIRFKNILGVEDKNIRKIINFDVWLDAKSPISILDNIEIKTFSENMYEYDEDYTIKTYLIYRDNQKNFNLNFNDKCEVKIIEERIIPLDDLTYSFRLETSAKNFKISLVFDHPDVELHGNLFGTASNPRNGIFIDRDSNSIAIESKKWMLKGNGAYINILPKNWSLKVD